MKKQKNREVQANYLPLFQFFNQKYCSLKKNGYYVIPSVQRQFIWKSKLYEGVLERLFITQEKLKKNSKSKKIKFLFLGHLLLYSEKLSNEVKVIDGQQRMVTITLILCVLRLALKKLLNNNEINKTIEEKELKTINNMCNNLNKDLNNLTKQSFFKDKEIINYRSVTNFLLKWINFFVLKNSDGSNETKESKLLLTLNNNVLEKILLSPNLPFRKKDYEVYILSVFEDLKNHIFENLLLRKEPISFFDSLSNIVNLILAVSKITFVVTKVDRIQTIDSEYSLFINLNAKRQPLTRYDLIKGYMMSKLDEFHYDTVGINNFGKKLDDELFNLVFTNYEKDEEDKIVKKIFHDIDLNGLKNLELLKSLRKEFLEWKKEYVKGALPNVSNCKLSEFFLVFWAYYVPKAFKDQKNSPINIEDYWVEQLNEKTPSILSQISKVIQDESFKKSSFWDWKDDKVSIILEKEKEVKNILHLFYAYIRTFSKSYFYNIFNIKNYFILNTIVSTNYFRPIIMRLILSILNENLVLDETKIREVKVLIELLVIYHCLQIEKTNDTDFPPECDEKLIVKNKLNSYGFWSIDLQLSIEKTKIEIEQTIKNGIIWEYMRGSNKEPKNLDRLFKIFLGKDIEYEVNRLDATAYHFVRFIPSSKKNLGILEHNSKCYNANLNLLEFNDIQIGNYFYTTSNISIGNKTSFKEIYGFIKTSLKKSTLESSKIFKKSMDELFEEGKKNVDLELVFQERTKNIINEFKKWLWERCNTKETSFKSVLVWGEVQLGKTKWICNKLLETSENLKKKRLTVFLVGETHALYNQARDRVIKTFKKKDDWHELDNNSTNEVKIFTKKEKRVILILDPKFRINHNVIKKDYFTHYIFLCLKNPSWLERVEEMICTFDSIDFTMIDDECDYYSLTNEELQKTKTINNKLHSILKNDRLNNIEKYTISATPFVNEGFNTQLDEIIIMGRNINHWNHFEFLKNEERISCFRILDTKVGQKLGIYDLLKCLNEFLQENSNKPYLQFLINPGNWVQIHDKDKNSINEIIECIEKEITPPPYIIPLIMGEENRKQLYNDKKPSIIIGGKKVSRGLTFEYLNTMYLDTESDKDKSLNISSVLQKARWCGYPNDYKKYENIKIHISRPTFKKYIVSVAYESWLRFLIMNNTKKQKDGDFVLNIKKHRSSGFEKIFESTKKIIDSKSVYRDLENERIKMYQKYGIFYKPFILDPMESSDLKRELNDIVKNYPILETDNLIGINLSKNKFGHLGGRTKEITCLISNVRSFLDELTKLNKTEIIIVKFPTFSFDTRENIFKKDEFMYTRVDIKSFEEI